MDNVSSHAGRCNRKLGKIFSLCIEKGVQVLYNEEYEIHEIIYFMHKRLFEAAFVLFSIYNNIAKVKYIHFAEKERIYE